MKIIKFKGGLGNQLFQYAFLRNLELIYNIENVKGDFSYYADIINDDIRIPRIKKINAKLNIAEKKEIQDILIFKRRGLPSKLKYKGTLFLEKTFNTKYFFESNREYRNIDKLLAYDYFDGYWQSWKYADNIKDLLIKELTPNFKFSEKTIKLIDKINNQNAVFIGIRRGDYLENKKAIKHYGNLDTKYYQNGINLIKAKIENPIFYIFSNDIKWVKKNMKLEGNIVYRNKVDQTSDIEELFIMAACKHSIISNSTFNWWGAWLISNKNKIIITPKVWFADNKPIDIIPKEWLRL